ncbi:MAG: response regulator transcription factor [Sutterella wadsworthensis]|nr:response regulator transcription factor [Sutterella wadsworthensis]
MSIRILVVDDNPDILANVKDFLTFHDGWIAETCLTGCDALERLNHAQYDLLILDVGLPDIDGLTITRRLRESGHQLPILILTARDTIDDRVEGLRSGADDYLVKPFSLRELAARVEALLRRSGTGSADRLTVGPLTLDLKTLRVTRNSQDIRLNPMCLQLLRELMQRSPGVVGRNRLEAILWQGEAPASDSLRSNLYLLRQAVDKPFDRPLIHTHPGLGWSVSDE